MALKYNVEYNNTAKIGDRTFKFRPWTTKNEKEYLIVVESEEDITDEKLFNILIRPCLEDPEVALSDNEQKMLMIEIRKKSLGSSFPMRYVCKKCKQVNDLDVEFDKIIEFKPDNFSPIKIQNLVFNIGPIISKKASERLGEQESNIEYAFIDFLLHIHSIEIDGEIEDTFTFDELNDFIEDLPTYIFDDAYKQFQKMKSSLEFGLKTYCMICNEENNVEFDHIPNFLWT